MNAWRQVHNPRSRRRSLEEIVADHRLTVDVQHAPIVAGGGEVDRNRRCSRAGDHDTTVPACFDIVADVEIVGIARAVEEAIRRDVWEIDGADQL